jgi:predicted  nucleic acid-binding Zn-ribbon protein
MDPGAIGALIPVVAILAFAAIKIARIAAANPRTAPTDASPRLEALEEKVLHLERELAETQERLDFAERLLAKSRDEHRIG